MYKLRELERSDLFRINTWRNDPELISLLGAPFRYINLEIDTKWFDAYMSSRDRTVRCAVVDIERENEILGLVSLTSIDHINQSAELHIMIGDKVDQGRGIGSFALSEMLSHAFKNLNLQRVELTVLAENTRAQHVYEKFGFVCEGKKRKAKFKNGQFVDMLQYALLREEYVGQ